MIYELVNPNRGFYAIFVPLIKVLLSRRDWDCLPFERNFRVNGPAIFLTKKPEHIESYHLIRSFGCRCFVGHKLKNTNRESKSKTQVPMTKTLIIYHLESYSWVVRNLLIMATRIEQLLLLWFGRVTSPYLSWALLSLLLRNSRY